MPKKAKKYNRNPKNVAIGDLIRRNAYVMKGKQKILLKVSPSVVKEYIARIICNIEINAPGIAEIAHRDGRSTILVKYKETKDGGLEPIYDDVTQYFGRMDSEIVSGTHIYCTKCLKKIEKEQKK